MVLPAAAGTVAPVEPVRAAAEGVEIDLWVVPNASRTEIAGRHGGALRVRVAVPATGGRANEAACRLIAERTGGSVELVRGHRSRRNVVRVRGVDSGELQRRLGV